MRQNRNRSKRSSFGLNDLDAVTDWTVTITRDDISNSKRLYVSSHSFNTVKNVFQRTYNNTGTPYILGASSTTVMDASRNIKI